MKDNKYKIKKWINSANYIALCPNCKKDTNHCGDVCEKCWKLNNETMKEARE